MLTFFFVVLARCVGQDTLDDIGHFSGIGAGSQHLTKRGGSFLGVFSGRGHWAIMSFEMKRRPQRPLLQRIVSGPTSFCQWRDLEFAPRNSNEGLMNPELVLPVDWQARMPSGPQLKRPRTPPGARGFAFAIERAGPY